MTRDLRFRPKAIADLDDIWAYTTEHWSDLQAQRYLEGLDQTLTLLCSQPEIARQHTFDPPVRIFPYQSHLVIFVTGEDRLEVIRILHMQANWQVLLTE